MRSNTSYEQVGTRTGAKAFSVSTQAADPAVHVKIAAVFVLALLTMIVAGVMTMHPSNASQADELGSVASQGLTAAKGDRIATSSAGETCRDQAWGAWSEDCAAAITGASRVRNVAFVTVEKSTPTVNETILARYPKTN